MKLSVLDYLKKNLHMMLLLAFAMLLVSLFVRLSPLVTIIPLLGALLFVTNSKQVLDGQSKTLKEVFKMAIKKSVELIVMKFFQWTFCVIVLGLMFVLVTADVPVSKTVILIICLVLWMPLTKYTYGLHCLMFYDLKTGTAIQMSWKLAKESLIKLYLLNVVLGMFYVIYFIFAVYVMRINMTLVCILLPLSIIPYLVYYAIITAMFVEKTGYKINKSVFLEEREAK